MNDIPEIKDGPVISAYDLGNWVNAFRVNPDEDQRPKLAICGPRFHAYLTGRFDPETPRNRFAGNAHQKRKIRRYQDRMWAQIGSFDKPPTKPQPEPLRGLAGLIQSFYAEPA